MGELADPRALALEWIGDRAEEWGILDQGEFNVDSPYLDPQAPADRVMLQDIADFGVRVTLNSVAIAPSSSGERV